MSEAQVEHRLILSAASCPARATETEQRRQSAPPDQRRHAPRHTFDLTPAPTRCGSMGTDTTTECLHHVFGHATAASLDSAGASLGRSRRRMTLAVALLLHAVAPDRRHHRLERLPERWQKDLLQCRFAHTTHQELPCGTPFPCACPSSHAGDRPRRHRRFALHCLPAARQQTMQAAYPPRRQLQSLPREAYLVASRRGRIAECSGQPPEAAPVSTLAFRQEPCRHQSSDGTPLQNLGSIHEAFDVELLFHWWLK